MFIKMRARDRAVAVLVVTLSSGVSCSMTSAPTGPGSDAVKAGHWGGQHIDLNVMTDQTAVEFDCGRATIAGRINIDGKGAFEVAGKYFQEGGPARLEPPPARPVRFSGTVQGDSMQVRAVLTDSNDLLGDFTVSFGVSPRLIKCA